MNNQQFVSLVTKIIVALCAWVATKWGFTLDGVGIAATAAPVIVGALATWWAHVTHATAVSPGASAPGSKPGNILSCWLLLGVLGICLLSGCRTTLDPAGVYPAKFGPLASWMWAQDNLVDSAVKTIDAAESWELENHAFLVTNSPQVVITLASVRIQARKAILTYHDERDNLAAVLASTNAPQMVLAVSNSIVTTVSAINTFSQSATQQQTLK